MMNLDPRTRTENLGLTEERCYSYSGALPYGGRRHIEGSVVFRIGDAVTNNTYFEGRPEKGIIKWRRVSGAEFHGDEIVGQFNPITGFWTIEFRDPDLLHPGEELTVTYQWQPHYLHGAEVLVRLNNEERMVPIADLQQALWGYLGDD